MPTRRPHPGIAGMEVESYSESRARELDRARSTVSLVTQLVARDACRCTRARDKTRIHPSPRPSLWPDEPCTRGEREGTRIRELAGRSPPLPAGEIDRPRRKSMLVQLFKSLPGKKGKEGRTVGRGLRLMDAPGTCMRGVYPGCCCYTSAHPPQLFTTW
jgi:hypothetical protein